MNDSEAHPIFTAFLARALEDPEVRAAYEEAQRRHEDEPEL